MDKFSVLMAVYKNDKTEFFTEAFDSVINQTAKPHEIVIVRDGIVPAELEQKLIDYEKEHEIVKIVRLEENVGLGNALKEGTNHCSHELIARMDSDDICLPDRFEKQLKAFEEDRDLSIIGGNIEEFIESKDKIVSARIVPRTHEEVSQFIKKRCPMNHMAVMFRKSEVLKAGGYIHQLYNEDYFLWIRMFLAGCKFKNLAETLVYVRIGRDMFKRRGGVKYFRSEKQMFKFMRKNRMIGLFSYLKSVFIRLAVQVLMPRKLRGWLYLKALRGREAK
ncbi:MAG: glycosyltransferase [Firmicutes bacterium]|nr:glycosyltransferase [Bacillota bacterium]